MVLHYYNQGGITVPGKAKVGPRLHPTYPYPHLCATPLALDQQLGFWDSEISEHNSRILAWVLDLQLLICSDPLFSSHNTPEMGILGLIVVRFFGP